MKIAQKYCMENTQREIATQISRIIDLGNDQPLRLTCGLVGLLVEFPTWFKTGSVVTVLSRTRYESVEALDVALLGNWDAVALMMQYVIHQDGYYIQGMLEKLGFQT